MESLQEKTHAFNLHIIPWPRHGVLTSLGFFLSIQILGLLLRWQFIQGIPGFNFKFFLHAHSHVALLGWVHALLMLALMRAFVPHWQAQEKSWKRLFWGAQLCVLGMLLSFPFQGYAAVSIGFSTLFLFVSYAQAARLIRQTRTERSLARWMLVASLWLMVLSSLGPWSLGPIMALKLNQSPIYFLAIYFYLHFQYNGWFVFALAALFLKYLELRGQDTSNQLPRLAFFTLFLSVIPAYGLSALWAHPPAWVWGLSGLSALLQCFSLVLLWRWGLRSQDLWKSLDFWPRYLLTLTWFCFNLKLLLQALTALPYFADLVYHQRALVIFYLHLVLLGCVSAGLLAWLLQEKGLQTHPSVSTGILLYLAGFGSSEILILLQGMGGWLLPPLPLLPVLIFAFSLLIPVGWGLIFLGQFLKPAGDRP
ncbi:hypothetical protein COW36_15710 [bacterium (Candidatus Blackallbacteria) CG17_big_fil_post_rev_8_21_14_2_50_48_46]|uniref:Cytochrome oxidase subunit I profile domain-containing protein n=1 Tax=bacterium (Candidatus Blackallbacteria) CG17_big_fil_post_rev_8_21_14_2_50_48_46 TaxID=2014261 RepID=A0A2M7G1Z5_9BACT|nr:MAG: hypothetical protein COW64_24395 [bacterium (Candidatus Blackallbacteria) CG18_big_fil_WC_8_21_14_2_50_49_26]PIW15792.1 MAG: hypothetical protein COW36_15710 [bacterium (Candidatus Blackallbacteria) CG17_big_fil_post_rev_8_21_14_2_50_48_46]PIW47777.1 MAG: hypothetical protein COW20_11405 [bacterium (Candidatus Blackallbacteria) CG13_big_fil_rev_8_21_14_2_50_49_14]